MNTVFVPPRQTVTSVKKQCADGVYRGSENKQTDKISYEHEGYQIRIHFSGKKTLKQCIQNLAEREFASGDSSADRVTRKDGVV